MSDAKQNKWNWAPYGKKTFGLGERGGDGAFFMVNTRYMTTSDAWSIAAMHKIGAAPEMEEALSELMCWSRQSDGTPAECGAKCETESEAFEQAFNALAKARGEA